MTSSKSPLSVFHFGKTASFACQFDQRFSYCLHVPRSFNVALPMRPRVLVAVHDTARHNQSLRDQFADFAEASGTIVLCPLFPGNVGIDDDLDGYKYLRYADVRYDQVLIAMVEEVAGRYGFEAPKFMLFGFSGGGHFAHRFAYLHPELVTAAVVASPGSVTLPVKQYQWWVGVGDFSQRFGKAFDLECLRRVRMHLVVGANDTNPAGIVQSPESKNWVPGADATGTNRVERLHTLYRHLLEKRVPVSLEVVDGVGHEVGPIVTAAIRFFNDYFIEAAQLADGAAVA